MRLKESFITLEKVCFHALHGVLPQERKVGNDYLLTLRVGIDVSRAMESDQVSDTLNYAELYELARQEMAIPSNLIEHVAARIAQRVFRQWPQAASVDLTLTKKNPPMGADCEGASVELHLINDKTAG